MKTLLALLIAAGVAAGATFLYVSNRDDARLASEKAALQAQWDKDRAETDKALTDARRKGPGVSIVGEAPKSGKSAEDILTELKGLKVAAGAKRGTSQRKVIYRLGSLAALGDDAVPSIRGFLKQYEDVDYSATRDPAAADDGTVDPDAAPGFGGGQNAQNGRQGRNGQQGAQAGQGGQQQAGGRFGQQGGPGGQGGPFGAFAGAFGRGNRNRVSMDFTIPPTLRLGLIDVLREIATPSAEQGIAEVLGTSGRGVEVAYAASALDEMAPKKYRAAAVTAAKDLLSNPPTIEKPTRLDRQAQTYLFNLLEDFGDSSFAQIAGNMLLGADGVIDRDALDYLIKTLKADAMPYLYNAYNDTRMTNAADKATILTQALQYAGSNPQANEMIKTAIQDPNSSQQLKLMALMSLSGAGFGGGGPGGGGGQQANQTPRDPQTLASQLALVTQIQAGVQDETTLKMLDFTANNIKALQNGEQPQGMRQLMQTLGPGAFGGGPGGGGFGGGRQGVGQNGQAVQGGAQGGQQGGQQGGRRNRGGN